MDVAWKRRIGVQDNHKIWGLSTWKNGVPIYSDRKTMEGMSKVYVVVAVVMIVVGIVIGGCRSRVWFCITQFEMLVRHLRKDAG